MRILIFLALKHLLARKRQSFVSLMGIVLGVAFFLAISSLMQGSEADAIRRLVDNTPHITLSDEFRAPRRQALSDFFQDKTAAFEIRHLKPENEPRGIRGFKKILHTLEKEPGTQASPLLTGQALVQFAGKTSGLTLNGMIPEEISKVSTIADYLVAGSLRELIRSPEGILIGSAMASELSLSLGDILVVSSSQGQIKRFKIVGIFRTGRSSYDKSQAFISLKSAQVLFDQPNRSNSIIVKMEDPSQAYLTAQRIENTFFYKAVSWQEASEDLLNTLTIRNRIMYTVVSAVLVVAAFGIYNVISTVVLEKQRDIAILKSMGFFAKDIRTIFLVQGGILGVLGCFLGLPLGTLFMRGLMQIKIKPPGGTGLVSLPTDWGVSQFLIAGGFAFFAAVLAAWLPARKAASLEPVDILRGS